MAREGSGAVVDHAGGSISVEPILIADPGPGEVLVRLAASGVCHSDVWAIEHGNWGSPWPMLLGHEGAGVVEAVGEGVTNVSPGDRVVIAWAVPCGRCRQCRRGMPRRCGHELAQPPRVTRARDGAILTGVLDCGTLATHTVVTAPQVVRMPDGIPLSRASLLGCGVSTGVGAAIQTAKVWPGATVAVIGLGGIGLAALQGAKIAGAERLIAVDVAPAKLGGQSGSAPPTSSMRAPGIRWTRCGRSPTARAWTSRSRRSGTRRAFVKRSRCWPSPAPRSRSACRPCRARSPSRGTARIARPTRTRRTC